MAVQAAQVRDYAALAQQRLHADIWAYLSDGNSISNEEALARVQLVPRPLQNLRHGTTGLSLFGQTLEHPIILAPIAYQRLFHADGECASAMAASAQGAQVVISSLASQAISEIVQAADGATCGKPWFQLYWQGNRIKTLELLRRAVGTGCSAVVFTVDAPVKVATLQLPPHIQAVNLEQPEAPFSGTGTVFNDWMAQAPTWDDLEWLRGQTRLPLLVKGLLHADDAAHAIESGCDGIIVSNHGGRVLTNAVPSFMVLERIVDRVAARIPVLFDSGIRSGQDVYAALAHGASAVLLGRPYIWGLAAEGAVGVARVIRLLRDELEMTMALTGCATLADIKRDCIFTA